MSRIKIGNIKGPKGDRGETGAVGPKGEQGIQGPVGPAGGVTSVNGKTGDVDIADALGYTPAGGVNLWSINNSTFRNVTYTGEQYEASDGDSRSPIIFVLQQWEGYNTSIVDTLNIEGNGIGLYKATGTVKSGCTIFRFKNNGATDEFWVDNPNSLKAGDTFTFSFVLVDDAVGHCKFKNIKLEPGTVTDPIWTPAPEDLVLKGEVDGRNLIPNTATPVTLTASSAENFCYSEFSFTEDSLVYGRRYTVSGNIDILAGTFDTVRIAITNDISDGHSAQSTTENVYIKATNRFIAYLTVTGNKASRLLIYAGMPGSTNNNSIRISNLKLELNMNPNPHWTPAPEDVVVRSELPISLNLIFPKNAGAHNSVFRGNDLGTSVTETQYAAINNGSFDDIFVGDYWTINNTVYRVAGLDIFLHVGDTELTKHHAVIVPDKNMYTHRMNETNSTTGAYWGSKMKTSGLDNALTTVQTAFGAEHILKHKVMLANAISGNDSSGWAWHESQIDLMTERQVYGSPAWGQAAHNGYDANSQYKQFPLFALAPEFICKSRAWYWLQDVRSASVFCAVGVDGLASGPGASNSGGVRPYFLIGSNE